MLPAGLTAHPLPSSDRAAFERLLPGVQTVAELLVGGCSCDLIRPRLPEPIEDERPLRARYRALGLQRGETIRALERHRQGARPVSPGGAPEWGSALAAFVAEHARNAGPTLYYLTFRPHRHPGPRPDPKRLVSRSRTEVRSRPAEWLEEDVPTVVQ